MYSGADNTGIQTVGVIVDVHRGQARSHRDLRGTQNRRSEPAREKRAGTTGIQTTRVIVDAHREQARSYMDLRRSVGASPLAKNVRAPRAFRRPALSLTSIASRLAPTGICVDL